MKLKVICRNSPLSLRQVQEVFDMLPKVDYEVVSVESLGDKNKHISLMDDVPADFFTRELDVAVLNGSADIAVHSAKDLPYPLPAGLELLCLTPSAVKTDSLVSRANLRLADLPAGAVAGTSSSKRKAELLRLRPDLKVTPVRGSIEERIAQVDDGLIDALIVATCALDRLGLRSRIAEELPFDTHPLQGNLAVIHRAPQINSSLLLDDLFSNIDIRRTYGRVVLAGFGPGNPDYLTIAADRALHDADVIFHDDLTDRKHLERYTAEKVYVGKRRDHHSHSQDEINEMLYRAATAGRRAVRLKGGDPMIFAHGREEIDYLQSRFVEVEVIPGITSAIALAATTHIPLTYRGLASSVAFVTGHSDSSPLVSPEADTIVYFMAGANISAIAKTLIKKGRKATTPVALVSDVSLPTQQTIISTLEELQFSVIKYPAPILVVIGEVVSLEKGIFSKTLLTASKIQDSVETGRAQSPPVDKFLHDATVHTPLIKIHKAAINIDLASNIKAADRIVFTSRYGVRYFFEMMFDAGLDIRSLADKDIDSVGRTTTAELRRYLLNPSIESPTESAEGLINVYKSIQLSHQSVLLPHSDKALPYLADELRTMANTVVELTVYHNRPNADAEKPDLTAFTKIAFASPTGVEAYIKLYGSLPSGKLLTAKGLTTETKLKSLIYETIQTI
ncbi:MAG: uroporphyrinogen-III C-methyltransferase [Tannerella sp.]|jgi:uroporphyrinogen III methyltransferase/synthase|nr:uroporphyrinogen-III C-methyltransferase [Tannerella sp.]